MTAEEMERIQKEAEEMDKRMKERYYKYQFPSPKQEDTEEDEEGFTHTEKHPCGCIEEIYFEDEEDIGVTIKMSPCLEHQEER